MNMLVDYASESESEDEVTLAPSKKQEFALPVKDANERGDDDFILAALKDLQDFAASVDTSNQQETTSTANDSKEENRQQDTESSTSHATADDLEDLQLLAFLKEVDAIPFPADEHDPTFSSQPPPPPPPPPDPMQEADPPPPLETPSEEVGVHESSALDSVSQCVYSAHVRLQQLFILPASNLDLKDLERRILEFAIRIVDWENGGLESSYFLGEAKANAEAQQSVPSPGTEATQSATDWVPYGGVLGSMLKHLHELEYLAAPTGWISIWDPADEAYGFQHVRTGAYLSTYPTLEQIHYLDPPPLPSPTAKTTQGSYRKSTYVSRPATGASFSSVSSPTSAPQLATFHNQWSLSSMTSPTNGSPSKDDSSTLASELPTASSPTIHPPSTPNAVTSIESTTVVPARKKRKVSDLQSEHHGSMDSGSANQQMHPSRRALLSTKSSATATAVSSSKFMPKKLASMLQKWSEKDRETSDGERDDDDDDGDGDNSSRTGHTAYEKSASGANSQALGSDWRERRLQQYNK
ncbi:hypothetical protein BGW38_009322 [Lunasporangiospora selenospora]|uniref:Uncharacterized protein n=1 Tax=Lunasporangiospora selenospora TaxID=979761 RepID=A0A9P6G2N6_9FUNG|nr:hypothetical protein BGW38_009322 [Lunasporangiospora selenospora]